jgi:hypothetical protein
MSINSHMERIRQSFIFVYQPNDKINAKRPPKGGSAVWAASLAVSSEDSEDKGPKDKK